MATGPAVSPSAAARTWSWRGGRRPSSAGPALRGPSPRPAADCLSRPKYGDAVADLADLVHPVRDQDDAHALRARSFTDRTGGSGCRSRAPMSPRRGSAPWDRASATGRCSTPGGRSTARHRRRCRAAAVRVAPENLRRLLAPPGVRWRSSLSAPSHRLSSTDLLSTPSTSWNTVSIPARSAWAGVPGRTDGRRPRSPGVRPVHAAEDLDQRALPGTVLPDEGMHLTREQRSSRPGEHPSDRSACARRRPPVRRPARS